MTKKKKYEGRLPAYVREAEKKDITQFVVSRTKLEEDVKTPMAELFTDYRSWRATTRRGNSRLSVDGFGRLFPKTFKRGSYYWAPVKHSVKCVVGLSLR